MSSVINKYIDIDSSYRNRTIYPLASDFSIPVSFNQSAPTVFTAKDPIFLSYPYEINKTAIPIAVLTNTFTLDATFLPFDNLYSNSYLEIDSLVLNPTYTKIINYVGATRVATTDTNVIIPVGAVISIRKELPEVRDTLAAGSTNVLINLGGLASSQNEVYRGYTIRFVTLGGVASTASGIIKSYNGLTKQALITFPTPVVPIAGDIYELMSFTNDNYNALIYSGTTIMTQPVCYSIELLYLTIPNTTIKNGIRGNLDSYPYFYVKLYNENKNSSNHILYSNNPHTNFATFKVPMTLTLNREKFFTLRDSKCVQVIKFSPDQDIHFTVTLPNGEPIEFLYPDYYSPNEPNPYLQFSASFAIRRIDGNKD